MILVLLELKTNPLRLMFTVNGHSYRVDLDPAAAEGLALALLANASPALATALFDLLKRSPELLEPELVEAINETAAGYAAKDRAILREMGVADAK